VVVVVEPVEERGGHLGIAERFGPLAEAEVGGDIGTGSLVEFAEQGELQRAS
jgi:hypothetical protein